MPRFLCCLLVVLAGTPLDASGQEELQEQEGTPQEMGEEQQEGVLEDEDSFFDIDDVWEDVEELWEKQEPDPSPPSYGALTIPGWGWAATTSPA